jgi:hypothetical protein
MCQYESQIEVSDRVEKFLGRVSAAWERAGSLTLMDLPVLRSIGRCEPRRQRRGEALLDGVEGPLVGGRAAEAALERPLEAAISIALAASASSIGPIEACDVPLEHCDRGWSEWSWVGRGCDGGEGAFTGRRGKLSAKPRSR